jgi:excisionase family DNA binding protein
MRSAVTVPETFRPEGAAKLPEPPQRPEPLQVTINEAARLLAYDARTIRRLIIRGELPAVGQGRLRRIPTQSLRDYQQRNLFSATEPISPLATGYDLSPTTR